jgi:hypothetical protein
MPTSRERKFIFAAVLFCAAIATSLFALGQDRSSSGENSAGFRLSSSPSLIGSQLTSNERAKLTASSFVIVRDAAAFPDACKNGFAKLTGEPSFALANPGQPYQATDVMTQGQPLPWRRLIFGGSTQDRCVIYYEKGGIATTHIAVVIDIAKANAPLFVWGGIDGTGPRDLPALISQITHGTFEQGGRYSW